MKKYTHLFPFDNQSGGTYGMIEIESNNQILGLSEFNNLAVEEYGEDTKFITSHILLDNSK